MSVLVPPFDTHIGNTFIYSEIPSLKSPQMLAGLASGCWLSVLGAAMLYNRKTNKNMLACDHPSLSAFHKKEYNGPFYIKQQTEPCRKQAMQFSSFFAKNNNTNANAIICIFIVLTLYYSLIIIDSLLNSTDVR